MSVELVEGLFLLCTFWESSPDISLLCLRGPDYPVFFRVGFGYSASAGGFILRSSHEHTNDTDPHPHTHIFFVLKKTYTAVHESRSGCDSSHDIKDGTYARRDTLADNVTPYPHRSSSSVLFLKIHKTSLVSLDT